MKKLILLLFIPLVFACSSDSSDDDNSDCPSEPTLTTNPVETTTEPGEVLSSAFLSGEIINNPIGINCDVLSITNQGFVYSLQTQPTVDDNVINVNGENINYSLNDLPIGVTYYVRTYLTNTLGTFYGNEVSFTTPDAENPVYLDSNGVTVKAKDWAEVGMSGEINGDIYTVVDNETIRQQNSFYLICTTKVTDMSDLSDQSLNNYINLISWDVSNVTDMSEMFAGVQIGGTEPTFNYWDTSSVTNMQGMFSDAHFSNNLDQFNFSNWDVSNVTDMSEMFANSTFRNLGINNWDVSSVNDMSSMFLNADNLNDVNPNFDLNNWNVSSVVNMNSMFRGIHFLENLSDWDVSNVTDMSAMFHKEQYGGDFTNLNINNWNVGNVTDMSFMFTNSAFNDDISQWNVSNVTDMSGMFMNAPFNQPIGNWDVSNVTNMRWMFGYSSNGFSGLDDEVNDIQFNQDISQWDVSNVINMHYMFFMNFDFNQDISQWDVVNVTDMQWMFGIVSNWPGYFIPFNFDLSNWNVNNVILCQDFCYGRNVWNLPKPNFTNCSDDLGCD